MKTLAERREYQRRYWETHSRRVKAQMFLCPWRHSDKCMFTSTDPEKHHAHIHEHELAEMKGRPDEPVIKSQKTQKQAVANRAKRLEDK